MKVGKIVKDIKCKVCHKERQYKIKYVNKNGDANRICLECGRTWWDDKKN